MRPAYKTGAFWMILFMLGLVVWVLMQQQRADYVSDLEGMLADGTRLMLPIYSIRSINIGGQCPLRDIEVAVFPGQPWARPRIEPAEKDGTDVGAAVQLASLGRQTVHNNA